MGLDNGFYVYTKDEIDNIYNYESLNPVKWIEEKATYEYEIAYWRKCYNVKELAYEIMRKYNITNEYGDCGDYVFTYDAFKDFVNRYNNLITESEWDSTESIWSWKECYEHLENIARVLKSILIFLWEHREDEDTKIIFYDSW